MLEGFSQLWKRTGLCVRRVSRDAAQVSITSTFRLGTKKNFNAELPQRVDPQRWDGGIVVLAHAASQAGCTRSQVPMLGACLIFIG